ncbi:hypothetical protein yc1106_02082 [Curvularia clavata]|uniref:SnoaL-like domain-containing protein n=1 Tax=Curvularia clavata TaxID=95742 RepID=A0A9Q8Z6I5_CURCL|nr:hypothetical protein yc1106_02082 [Curvularia clavata]
MRFTLLASALVASVSVLAAPTDLQTRSDLIVERQSAPVKPAPCVRNPKTTPAQTEARFNEFAQAFIYKPDISKAFSFIAKDYINHNPTVKNGSDAAWDALSPFWNTAGIVPLRKAFLFPQGWVNYNTSGFGEVVDRFRWEGGCIVEHWDQNETFPSIPSTQKPGGKSCPSRKH